MTITRTPTELVTKIRSLRSENLSEIERRAMDNILELVTNDPDWAEDGRKVARLTQVNGCASCGDNRDSHGYQWSEAAGQHSWVAPSDDLRKARIYATHLLNRTINSGHVRKWWL